MPRARSKTPLLALFAAGILLNSCGIDDESGACAGAMDGTYYRLRLLNLTEKTQEVRINGRFIGKVSGSTRGAGGELIPGDGQLGEFPSCDKAVIDARGEGTFSTKVCSNGKLLTNECRQSKVDYCWWEFLITDTGEIPTDAVFPPVNTPECEPVAQTGDPCEGAWLQCD